MERSSTDRILLLKILNVGGFLFQILVNIFASTGVLPRSPNDVSDAFPTAITPAGYAFSIWGVIYFLAALFVLYQLLPLPFLPYFASPANKDYHSLHYSSSPSPSSSASPPPAPSPPPARHPHSSGMLLFDDISVLFFLSCLLNGAWVILFAYELLWPCAAILSLLLLLVLLTYVRIARGLASVRPPTPWDYACVHLHFSVYAAWLSLATVVNWAVVLRGRAGWLGEPWTEEGWAVLMLCILAAVTMVMLLLYRDGAFGLAVAWGLVGVAANQGALRGVHLSGYILGAILAALSLVALSFKFLRWRAQRQAFADDPTSPMF